MVRKKTETPTPADDKDLVRGLIDLARTLDGLRQGGPRFGMWASRFLREDGTDDGLLVGLGVALWPGMRLTVATYTVEQFHDYVEDAQRLLGVLEALAPAAEAEAATEDETERKERSRRE